MRQSAMLTAALAAVSLSACGPGDVVVLIENQVQDPASGTMVSRPLANIEVDLLPYDRDVVFDSLTRAAATPEPEIPADVLQAQQVVAAAQQEWREMESRWNVLRDTLQKLNTTMEQFSRGEARYVALFQESEALRTQYDRLEGQVNQAFQRFDDLQKGSQQRETEVRGLREAWADETFRDAGLIFRDRVRLSKLAVAADTTDAAGLATFSVKPGQYWVHARYDLPFSQLYWNIPITVVRGEPVQLQLTRANAQERPRL